MSNLCFEPSKLGISALILSENEEKLKILHKNASLIQKKVLFLQPQIQMVGVAQLVRVPDCGSEGRGFESHLPPKARGSSEPLFLFSSSVSTKMIIFAANLAMQ